MEESLQSKIIVKPLDDAPPWDLLLLADPSRSQVESYLSKGDCYVASIDEEIVGAFVLLQREADTVELMNIAVAAKLQGQGLGKLLLKEVIAVAKRKDFRQLYVGTGNSSLDQLAFYQKAGFRISDVERDYFVQHYDQEIIENGIQCLDLIKLSMDL